MFRRVLIANRGEVALRILRSCKELGLETVAVYSREDDNLPHLDLADRAICIGAGGAATSYLLMDNILMAATTSGCDAIHPGYGFLAENAQFARRVEEAGMTFVGPSAEAIETMGDKLAARSVAAANGLKVVPALASATEAARAEEVARLGYPVIAKAAAGGGGRGMRIVRSAGELTEALAAAAGEAAAAFGDDRIYVERFLEDARHVEVQIIGDRRGNAIHLGTRDCSVQRRYQKLLEEAPAPAIPAGELEEIAARCVRMAAAMNYSCAGTFEFLFRNGQFYFMEMNTRLQVEHPVTEMVSGVDIVREQLLVAAGEALSLTQEEVLLRGHSIECRLNAEDEAFRPAPGVVTRYQPAAGFGVRMDSHLHEGYEVPHLYDSLVAKLICHGRDRDEAIDRMARALEETRIDGIESNLEWHRRLLGDPAFRNCDHYGREIR